MSCQGHPLGGGEGFSRDSLQPEKEANARSSAALRESEAALRESEAMLRSFFDSAGGMRGIVELVEDDIVHVSDNAITSIFYGQTKDSMRQKRDSELGVPPSTIKLWIERLTESRKTGAPVAFDYTYSSGDIDQWLFATVSYLGVSIQGNPRFAYVVSDITSRKVMEESLRASEQQYRATIDSLGDAVAVVNPEMRLLLVNEALLQLCAKVGLEQVSPGRDLFEVFPFLNEKIREEYRQVFETGNTLITEQTYHLGGKDVILEVRKNPIREKDRTTRVLTVIRDITVQRGIEEQLVCAQRIGSLALVTSSIARDLNNVLAPVLMAAPLLRAKVSDLESRHLLDAMESNAQRGAEIIKQLMVFGFGTDEERRPLALHHQIGDVVKLIQGAFPHVTARTALPKDLWLISVDSAQLNQILMNLSLNACDAMPKGGILSFSAENRVVDDVQARGAEVNAGLFVALKVRDTGGGIAPEALNRVFDTFFTTKEAGKGAGLGLPIVLKIAKTYGGFVEVDSKVGQGTELRVYFPAIAMPESVTDTVSVEPLCLGRGELVLLVEDEEAVREVLRETLETFGYKVVAVKDGAEALKVYVALKKDIKAVVTDLAMPLMDGMALTRELKRLDSSIPVIVSTGMSQKSQRAALHELGVDVLLDKPYMAGPLLSALQKVLR